MPQGSQNFGIGLAVHFHHYEGPPGVPPLDGKRVVVTGAGRGIGYHTAVGLAQVGADVTCVCRIGDKASEMNAESMEHMVNLNKGRLNVIWADLADAESVRQVAAEINGRGHPVDILINNAALLTPQGRWILDDGHEKQMRVNYTAHFALTGLLMPSLLKSDKPRVLNVSSANAWRGSLTWDGALDFANSASYKRKAARCYSDSKLAQLAFTQELGRRYPQITSVAAHPGVAATELHRYMAFLKGFFLTAEEAARMPLIAASDPSLKSGSYVGPWFALRGEPS
jgi:NAD(P)-dependent dehydrogenase (short-subunit alcohol dehydrogenase family)